MPTQNSKSVPNSMRQIYQAIVQLSDAFCREHLNDGYAAMCRKLAAALARKRPSPLSRGKPEIWACGVVYAIGSVNSLFDSSQTPHMRPADLCQRFGVKQSTCSNKGRLIRDLFFMAQMDPNWHLSSLLDDNPLTWMIEVNGLVVDVRRAPRETQEEAFRSGLIPYIPADIK